MKRLIIAAMVVAAVSMISANSHSDSIPDVAVTPDHPMYDIKLSVEDQIEELAPNDTEISKAKIERAENRLAETQTLTGENKTELANRTVRDYSEEMKELQKYSDGISDLAQKRRVNELVANATMLHTKVLSSVYEKVPEAASSGIQEAINQSVTGHQEAVKSLGETGRIPGYISDQNITSGIPLDIRGAVGRTRTMNGVVNDSERFTGQ